MMINYVPMIFIRLTDDELRLHLIIHNLRLPSRSKQRPIFVQLSITTTREGVLFGQLYWNHRNCVSVSTRLKNCMISKQFAFRISVSKDLQDFVFGKRRKFGTTLR